MAQRPELHTGRHSKSATAAVAPYATAPEYYTLGNNVRVTFSQSDLDVLTMLALGFTQRQINTELGFKGNECYVVKRLMMHLRAKNTTHAVAIALRAGIIE